LPGCVSFSFETWSLGSLQGTMPPSLTPTPSDHIVRRYRWWTIDHSYIYSFVQTPQFFLHLVHFVVVYIKWTGRSNANGILTQIPTYQYPVFPLRVLHLRFMSLFMGTGDCIYCSSRSWRIIGYPSFIGLCDRSRVLFRSTDSN